MYVLRPTGRGFMLWPEFEEGWRKLPSAGVQRRMAQIPGAGAICESKWQCKGDWIRYNSTRGTMLWGLRVHIQHQRCIQDTFGASIIGPFKCPLIETARLSLFNR